MTIAYMLTATEPAKPLYLAHPCRASRRTGYAEYRPSLGGVFVCAVCDEAFGRDRVEVGCPACAEPMAWGEDRVTCGRNPTHEWMLPTREWNF